MAALQTVLDARSDMKIPVSDIGPYLAELEPKNYVLTKAAA